MTTVTTWRSKLKEGSHRYVIHSVGHATGSEKVCAGVSAIMYSLVGWIVNNDDKLYYHREKMNSGDAEVEWWGDAEAQTAYDMAMIGLMQIEKKYPKFIKIEKNKIFSGFRDDL